MDATQGVQAQSLSVFHAAMERGLKIIPVLNKESWCLFIPEFALVILVQIDLPAAQPERIVAQIESTFGLGPEEVLQISAKSGKGVQAVLEAIVKRIPPPGGDVDKPLKAFLFDSSSVHFFTLLERGIESSVGTTVIAG